MHRDDLDLAAARDAVLRCRGKDLDGSVIREPDRATSARPDAHCDHRVTPDELRERCWPVPLSAAERREDPERRACPGDAESDAKKQALFEKVRNGSVRVLIGSTQKMGTGTNVQKRLVALHHLDAPWKPAEVEQRDGRILRQGNENEEVAIYRYVTTGSFDSD